MHELIDHPVSYTEFLAADDKQLLVGVRKLHRAVFIESGWMGVLKLLAAEAIVLAPAFGVAIFSIYSECYAAILWAIVAGLAFMSSRPDANGCAGFLWFLALPIGLVAAQWWGSPHAWGGFLPLVTYVAGSAVKGVTIFSLIDSVRNSADLFRRLDEQGELFFVKPYPEPPASAPDPQSEV